jgi:hypothetical protein
VRVDGFFIDRTELTNHRVDAAGYCPPTLEKPACAPAWLPLVASVLLALASAAPVRHVRRALRRRVRPFRLARTVLRSTTSEPPAPVNDDPGQRLDQRVSPPPLLATNQRRPPWHTRSIP